MGVQGEKKPPEKFCPFNILRVSKLFKIEETLEANLF